MAEHHSAPLDLCRRALEQRQRRFRAELECAGACIALSQDQMQLLSELGLFDGIEIDVLPLPPPVMPDLVSIPVIEAQARFSIVSWGGLVRGKGMHVLLEACQLVPEPAKVSVHHYGRILDEAYAQELRELTGPVDLHLHGAYHQREMGEHFARHDLAVFPSLFRETHGYVVDEAMLLGLPVLVSDRGAPRERIGRRGSTFSVGSAESLAEQLGKWMQDPQGLAEMRAAAPGFGATLPQHEAQVRAIYERALGR